MNRWQRFKRLTFWNKLGVVGAVCSILAIALVIVGWLFFRYRAGDTIINYGTIIKSEIAKADQSNVVTEEFIKDFFIRLQLSLSEKRVSLPQNELDSLRGYLQRSYDINVTISTSHGVGYEFITPSDNPKINIIKTNLPIEEYYFSKYTDVKDFSKAKVFRVSGKRFISANSQFIAGKKMIVVEQDGDVLLENMGLKYAKEDSTKEIEFLRLFANNQKNYWNQMNPKDEATFLFSANKKIITIQQLNPAAAR